jgi:hypothetical protein
MFSFIIKCSFKENKKLTMGMEEMKICFFNLFLNLYFVSLY